MSIYKLTKEIVQQRLDENNRGITIVGEYINNRTKTLFRHNICGYEWETAPGIILNGGCGCPKCAGNIQLTKEIVQERLDENNRGISIIGEYINVDTKTLFRHIECGHEWYATSDSVLNAGKGCPKCGGSLPLTKEIVQQRLDENNRGITILGDYINVDAKTLFHHNDCDYEWYATPDSVLNAGKGCPKCAGNIQLTKEIVQERLDENNRGITILGDYINNSTKTLFRHIECGHEWESRPYSILNGHGCPICAKFGFNLEKPAWLYYIKILHDGWYYYKIGVTNRNVDDRFKSHDKKKIEEILFTEYFDIGRRAVEKEQFILNYFSEHKYNGDPILIYGGNSEIFTHDVLKEHFVY